MAASDGQADLVFTGGKIRSPAHPSGFVQALAVRGGLIQAVGTDEEIRQVTGPRYPRGRTGRAAGAARVR